MGFLMNLCLGIAKSSKINVWQVDSQFTVLTVNLRTRSDTVHCGCTDYTQDSHDYRQT